MLEAVPDEILSITGPQAGWSLITDRPDGEIAKWATPTGQVRKVAGADVIGLDTEIANINWLGGFTPTELVVSKARSDSAAWLATADSLGHPMDRIELHGDVQSAIQGFGQALALLHSLPTSDVPFGDGWEALRADIESSLPGLDNASLRQPYGRYEVEELFTLWQEGRPPLEDLVVSHGRASMGNVFMNRDGLTSFMDVGNMRVVDRHFDLAVAQHSIQETLGGDAAFIFYDAYGSDPDLLRLDHYSLAAVLHP